MKTLTPHKHADVIHAFAEGAQLQRRSPGDPRAAWLDTKYPDFCENEEYRIKPEPEPAPPPAVPSSLSDDELMTAYDDGNKPTMAESLHGVAEAAIARHIADNTPAPGELPPAACMLETTLTDQQINQLLANGQDVLISWNQTQEARRMINAGITHAIAGGQVMLAARAEALLNESKKAVLDVMAVDQAARDKRDMAVAEAMKEACAIAVGTSYSRRNDITIMVMVSSADVIAGVKS